MAKNTAANDIDQTNAQKVKKADESLTTQAIKAFIEKKLSLGGDIFDTLVKSECLGLEADFMKFIAQNKAFDQQSKEQQDSFRAVNSIQFLRETISIGAGFASKREALKHIINRGYEFSDSELKQIKDSYNTLTRDELARYIASETEREKFLKNIFPGKTLPYKAINKQINDIFGNNVLTDHQEELVASLLVKKNVSPFEVKEVIELFNPNQQQLILKTFIPMISLGQLESMKVLTSQQVDDAIRKSIEQGNLIPRFANMQDDDRENAIKQIDPNDIIIETMLFPNEVVKTILLSDGAKMIAKELSTINAERFDSAIAENALKMEPSPDGLFLPPFLEKLGKLKIKNTADFKKGSIIKGTIPTKNGKDIDFAYRIDEISDNAVENKKNGGNGRVFALTDILLADGSLHVKKTINASPAYSYDELYHIFKTAGTKAEILSPEVLNHQVDRGSLKTAFLDEDIDGIHTLSELNDALDIIDPKGRNYPLKAEGGVSIQTEMPGHKDYAVYQITSINENKGTIEINNGQSSEVIDYVTFYTAFKSRKSARLSSMKTSSDFLDTVKKGHAKKDKYTSLSFEDGAFVTSEPNKDDAVTEFISSSDLIKITDIKTSGQVEFLIYEDFDEKKSIAEQTGVPTKYVGKYNLLYMFLNRDNFIPRITPKGTDVPKQKDAHLEHRKGTLKHYMGNPSLHDMMAGAKGVVSAIKHRLEHGSQLHAANIQLAIGRRLKKLNLIDDQILREMQGGVYGKNKEIMQKTVDALKKMSTGDREKEVKDILRTHGSHDYEIQAAALAMLQKHGALYVGDLKSLEGSFIFFERLSGMKFSKDLKAVKDFQERCDLTGEPFTEAGLIISYLKARGGDGTIDPTLWLDYGKGWAMGMSEEGTKGKDEVAKYQMGKGRVKHVVDKISGGEYAHGLGGLEGVWNKGGPAHTMHLPVILLALSNAPSSLHQDQLNNALKNKFFDGRMYTGLLFLGTPSDQEIFRSVIKEICISNNIAGEYKKIEDLQKNGPRKELFESITAFWEKHGELINRKLNVTEDGELIHLAKKSKDCAAYLRTVEAAVGNINKLNDAERDNEMYEHGGASFLGLNPDQYFKFIKMNAAQTTFESDDATQRLWPSFQKSLGAIRNMSAGSSEATKEVQKTLYMKYHKTLMSYLNSRLEKGVYETKLGDQDYMQELYKNYGIRKTPYGKAYLESDEYKEEAEKDFSAFLAGGRKDAIDEEVKNVGGSVTNVLNKTDYRGPAANNDSMRRAA